MLLFTFPTVEQFPGPTAKPADALGRVSAGGAALAGIALWRALMIRALWVCLLRISCASFSHSLQSPGLRSLLPLVFLLSCAPMAYFKIPASQSGSKTEEAGRRQNPGRGCGLKGQEDRRGDSSLHPQAAFIEH